MVSGRPVPKHQGGPYRFGTLSVETVNDQAMVKVSVLVFDKQDVDLLGLLKEEDRRRIVNKMCTTL